MHSSTPTDAKRRAIAVPTPDGGCISARTPQQCSAKEASGERPVTVHRTTRPLASADAKRRA
eukprot:4619629-Pleurochrysis_carterae.AAC.1